MPAEVNNYKRAKHPRAFFSSQEGGKYIGVYDFIPDLTSPLWDDHVQFIAAREQLMRAQFEKKYGLKLTPSPLP